MPAEPPASLATRRLRRAESTLAFSQSAACAAALSSCDRRVVPRLAIALGEVLERTKLVGRDVLARRRKGNAHAPQPDTADEPGRRGVFTTRHSLVVARDQKLFECAHCCPILAIKASRAVEAILLVVAMRRKIRAIVQLFESLTGTRPGFDPVLNRRLGCFRKQTSALCKKSRGAQRVANNSPAIAAECELDQVRACQWYQQATEPSWPEALCDLPGPSVGHRRRASGTLREPPHSTT